MRRIIAVRIWLQQTHTTTICVPTNKLLQVVETFSADQTHTRTISAPRSRNVQSSNVDTLPRADVNVMALAPLNCRPMSVGSNTSKQHLECAQPCDYGIMIEERNTSTIGGWWWMLAVVVC